MNYESITTCDVANGEEIGVVLWVSGCDLHCPGCHNQETWDPSSGKPFDDKAKEVLFKELSKEEIKRLTISGGHPLMPCNVLEVNKLLFEVKLLFPHIKIWLYTGYKYEDLNIECKDLVENFVDVLVDGPYVEGLRDISLPFRGSSNQRIIRIKHK